MKPQQLLVRDQSYRERFADVTIYGVAGTNGSGKDLLLEIMEENGFYVYNAGDNLRQISRPVFQTTRRGGGESPVGKIANAERAIYPGGLVDLAFLEWWAKIDHLPAELKPRGLIIGSIRGVGEAERLKLFGGKLVLVDAPIKIRYERLKSRGRHYEQSISFEDFKKEEAAELAEGETDPTKFGMAAVIKMADILIENTSDIDTFRRAIQQKLL